MPASLVTTCLATMSWHDDSLPPILVGSRRYAAHSSFVRVVVYGWCRRTDVGGPAEVRGIAPARQPFPDTSTVTERRPPLGV